jgi:hypothetical protein
MRSLLLTTILLPLISALFIPQQTQSVTCGSDTYTISQLDAALQKGYSLYQAGKTEGSDKYPHEYEDHEGFTFLIAGPWYEFPILESEVYSGGSPGADRIVFNGSGNYAGSITHTGAKGDDFVGCSDTS